MWDEYILLLNYILFTYFIMTEHEMKNGKYFCILNNLNMYSF